MNEYQRMDESTEWKRYYERIMDAWTHARTRGEGKLITVRGSLMFILDPFILSSKLIRPLRLKRLRLTSPLASNLVRQKLHD